MRRRLQNLAHAFGSWSVYLNMSIAILLAAGMVLSGAAKTPASFYDFTMNDIDGKPVHLKKFRHKVLLVVNVASFCGNTPQYAALETLYKTYKKKGFAVLGFPANEFGQQEPGDDATIKQFCTAKYSVTFPMFSKIVVKGDNINPLYSWLIAHADRHDDIEWNFAKFLIGKNGEVVARFAPKTKPDSPEVTGAIQTALGIKTS
jgi:glutathione peroxidase